MIEAEREFKVEFNDCDPMGVVWNGKYFDYFEMGRSALLDSIGLNYMEIYKHGYMLPLVRNKIKYISPLRPGDMAVVKVNVLEYDMLFKFSYEIRKVQDGKLIARGESSQMFTDQYGNGIGYVPEFARIIMAEADIK